MANDSESMKKRRKDSVSSSRFQVEANSDLKPGTWNCYSDVPLLDLVGLVIGHAGHALLELDDTAAQRPHHARQPMAEQNEDHDQNDDNFPVTNAKHNSLSLKK